MSETTKKCPYCAETIQAAAVVCRYCQRDLVAPVVPAVSAAIADDRLLLDRAAAEYTRNGWRIVNQTPTSFQAAKPKQWNRAGVVLFVVLPLLGGLLWSPLFGVSVFGLLLVTADYLLKKEEYRYLTLEDIRAAGINSEGAARIRKTAQGWACSACGGAVAEGATNCRHCKRGLYVPAEVYANSSSDKKT